MAIASIIRFHNGMLSHMQEHKPMMKFFAFKAVVGLEFLEQVRKEKPLYDIKAMEILTNNRLYS